MHRNKKLMFKIKDYEINSFLLCKAVRFFFKDLTNQWTERLQHFRESLYGSWDGFKLFFSVPLNTMSLELDARVAEVV